MARISHAQARAMLRRVCQRYVAHNDSQLATLKPEGPCAFDNEFFFKRVRDPRVGFLPGFRSWVICKQVYMMDRILGLGCSNADRIPLEARLKYWERDKARMPGSYSDEWYRLPVLDESAPDVMLFNTNSLVVLLKEMIAKRIEHDFTAQFDAWCKSKDIHWGFLSEDAFIVESNAMKAETGDTGDFFEQFDAWCQSKGISILHNTDSPLATQINMKMHELELLLTYLASLPKYQECSWWMPRFIARIKPTIECYTKGVLTKELLEILNSDRSDEEAIAEVEAILSQPQSMHLLEKKQQSKSEQHLKILSVISILVGVGIFTTLGLVCKRLYDSGGSSMNFFKPLSENLREDAHGITNSIVNR